MKRLPLTVVLFALVAGACSGGGGDDAALDVELGLADGHALVGRLVIETREPSRPGIRVVGSERTFEIPVTEAATRHVVPVAGSAPSTTTP